MELCTNSNVIAYTERLTGLSTELDDAKLTEEQFNDAVNDLFKKTSDLSKWEKGDLLKRNF